MLIAFSFPESVVEIPFGAAEALPRRGGMVKCLMNLVSKKCD